MARSRSTRVQPRALGRGPGLRPAAAPVDTYSRPAQPAAPAPPPSTNGWLELAGALSSVEPALSEFVGRHQEQHKDEMREAARERLAGMTFKEALQARREGTLLVHDDPWHQRFTNEFLGAKAATNRLQDLRLRLAGENTSGNSATPNQFRPEADDFEAFIRAPVPSDLAMLEGDDAQRGYMDAIERGFPGLMEQETRRREQAAHQRSHQMAFETVLGLVEGRLADDPAASPEAVHSELRAAYRKIADGAGLSLSEMDGVTLEAAKKLAEDGHVEIVREILTSQRGGIGSISKKRELAGDVLRVVELAEARNRENVRSDSSNAFIHFADQARHGTLDEAQFDEYRERNPGVITNGEHQNLVLRSRAQADRNQERLTKLRAEQAAAAAAQRSDGGRTEVAGVPEVYANGQGGLLDVMAAGRLQAVAASEALKPNGETVSYSASELIKRGVEEFVTEQSPMIAAQRGETPDQTFDRELLTLSSNGVTHPRWKRLLNTAVASVSPATVSDADLPESFMAGFGLYRQLRAKNPHYLRQHISDGDTIDFYETVRLGVERMGLGLNQAVMDAVRITSNEYDAPPAVRARVEDLRRTLQDVQGSQEWLFGAFGAEIENVNAVAGDLEKIASLFVLRGLEKDEALSLAAERIMDNHAVVKGRLLPTGDRRMQAFGATLRETHDAMKAAEPDRDWLGVEPRAFPDVINDFVQKAIEPRYLDYVDPEDVVLAPHGNAAGLFVVLDRESNSVLLPEWDEESGESPPSALIKLDDIARWEVERQQAERAEARAENIATNDRLQDRRAFGSGRAGARRYRRSLNADQSRPEEAPEPSPS